MTMSLIALGYMGQMRTGAAKALDVCFRHVNAMRTDQTVIQKAGAVACDRLAC